MIVPDSGPKPYYSPDGKRVPSVTTILGVVDKPYLLKWANNLGLAGTTLDQERERTTGIGTLLHAYIEGLLKNESVDDRSFSEEQIQTAKRCLDKFLVWHSEHEIVPIATEYRLASGNYGGTMDAILEVDGILTILDWKTSKSISPEYFAQLSAYYHLYNMFGEEQEHNHSHEIKEVKQIAVLKVPKENGMEYEYSVLDVETEKFRNAWEYFNACFGLYNARKRLA